MICALPSVTNRLSVLTLPLIVACGAAVQPGAAGAPTAIASATSSHEPGAVGEPAAAPPDFELEALSGDFVRLSDHLGKQVVLIDFWATFCHPCLAAMPHLEELYGKYKDRGLLILGVSIDGPDSVAQVRGEVARLGVSFPIW